VAWKNTTSPYTANAFTKDPPNGGITQFQQTLALQGFIATSGSFGFSLAFSESGRKAYFTFYRMYGAIGTINLDYSTSDGTAVAGVDYTAVSGRVTWLNGDITSRTIVIPLLATTDIVNKIFNFNVFQAPFPTFFTNTFVFTGGLINPFPGPNYTTALVSTPITIVRQGRGELDMVGTPYSVQRPGGTTTVTVQAQRFNGFKGAVGCSFHTTDGTAVAGVDYTALSGTLSWADGEGGTKDMVITILSGGSGTKTFTVTIDTPTGGVTIGSVSVASVNIVAAAPPANPVAGGSIPQQLGDTVLPEDATLWWRGDTLCEPYLGVWNGNITYNGMLNNKIGSWIGIGPGTDSFGSGTDFINQTPDFIPLTQFKYQGYINGHSAVD
jgi:hypothetical protein